jgi:hypothetical protein
MPFTRPGRRPQHSSMTRGLRSSIVGLLWALISSGTNSGQSSSPRLKMSSVISGRGCGYLKGFRTSVVTCNIPTDQSLSTLIPPTITYTRSVLFLDRDIAHLATTPRNYIGPDAVETAATSPKLDPWCPHQDSLPTYRKDTLVFDAAQTSGPNPCTDNHCLWSRCSEATIKKL